MATNCPTCDKCFESESSMKIHHKLSHNESLAKSSSECDVVGCDNGFEYYPSEKSGLICPDCIESGKNIWDTETHKNLPEKLTTYVGVDCHYCGKSLEVTKTEEKERNFCSNACINNFNSQRMSGKNNPRYVDGESSGRKYSRKWKDVREKALVKDGGNCIVCGSKESLQVHHIIPVRLFENENDAHYIENAITLCPSCHKNVEYGNVEIPYDSVKRELEQHRTENFKYNKI